MWDWTQTIGLWSTNYRLYRYCIELNIHRHAGRGSAIDEGITNSPRVV